MKNIKTTGHINKSTIHINYSDNVLDKLIDKYDIIYIDGSHEYKDVLNDANNCWKLLNDDGIMIFDDYRMSLLYTKDRLGVKPAVDEFLQSINGKYELLNTNFVKPKARNIIGYQCMIRKLP
jgi:predicted O-methyltransferase YrrM